MKHETIQEKLLAAGDKEVSPDERRELMSHLAECEDCRLRFGQWTRLQNLFAQAEMPASSEAFVFQVMEKITELETASAAVPAARARLFPRLVFPVLGYAFAAFLLFLVLPSRVSLAVNVKSMLLAELPQEEQWTVAQESSTVDDLLNLKEDL